MTMVTMIDCRSRSLGTGGVLVSVLLSLWVCAYAHTAQLQPHTPLLTIHSATPEQRQQHEAHHNIWHHFWRWKEPQQHPPVSSTSFNNWKSEALSTTQPQQHQSEVSYKDRRLSTIWADFANRPPSLSSSSSSSSRRRKVLQISTAAAAPYQPPRVFVNNLQATVVNTYSWDVSRTSSATSIAVTADGADRKQMGYTLTFTRGLQSSTYTAEGAVEITNLMGTSPLTLLSVTVYVGTTAVNPACRTLPGSSYTMQPTEVLSCPFRADLTSAPGGPISVTAFVQTSNGRKAAENSPPPTVSFTGCSSSALSTASCVVRDVGRCVTVTDGSRIISRYQDRAGAAAAGPIQVSQSQLFETNDVALSTLGPPRTEPTLPNAPPAADPPLESTYVQPAADNTWWNRRRRFSLRRSLLQSLGINTGGSSSSFTWPIPQITGVRPPVGLLGKPAGVEQPLQICDTTPFSFSMIFGPLRPEACGIFEVVSTAAAAYVDNSQPAVSRETYTYLQVICPPPAEQQQNTQQQQQQQGGTPNMLMGNRFQSMDQSDPDDAAATAAGSSSSSDEDLGPVTGTATTSTATTAGSSSTGNIIDDSITGGGSSSSSSVKPPDLRVSIIQSRPVLLTSYSWSLTGGPAARTNPENNVTEVGCWLRAERGKGSTTQIITGTVRLGNPVAPTDPTAVIMYVTGVSVTTVITTGAGRQAQPVTVPADCQSANSNGEVQLMPFHRVNCTFEVRVTTTATPVFPLTGNILATAVLQVSRGSAATVEVSSSAIPFVFQIPAVTNTSAAAAAGSSSSSNGATQQVALGSCARLSSGIVLADMLPVDSGNAPSAAAGAAAAAADDDDPLTGSSGECDEVCGADEPSREVTHYAPVDGYNKYQCGEHTVSCVGFIMPDNGAWQGAGLLSPAAIVTNTTVTVNGRCYDPNAAAAAAANGTDGSSGSNGSGDAGGDTTGDNPTNPGDGATDDNDADSAAGDDPADQGNNPGASPAPDDAGGDNDGDAPVDDDEYRDYDPESDAARAGDTPPAAAAAAAGNGTSSSTNRLNEQQQQQQVTYSFNQVNAGGAGIGAAAASSSNVFLPLKVSLQQVASEQLVQYVWSNRLNLATAASSSSGSGGLTLTARYTRSVTPTTGTVRGQIELQAAAAPSSGLLRLAAASARNASVLLLLPCGGSIAANLTGSACSSGEITLPATCQFEASGVDVAAAPAVVVVASAEAVVPVNGSTAASSTSSSSTVNGTSNSTAQSAVLITVQSVPQVVTFSRSPEVEMDRCVNVTNNFRLTPAGDVSSADGVILTTTGSSGSSSSAVNGSSSSSSSTDTLPLLVPVSPLPDALCGNSQVQYKLTAGGSNAAAAAVAAPGG